MSDDLLSRIQGWSCPTELHPDPFARLIGKLVFDSDGYQRGKRINGCVECPHCGSLWPILEEPDEWSQGNDGRWYVIGWGPGIAECLQCERIFVDTFDGCFELKF